MRSLIYPYNNYPNYYLLGAALKSFEDFKNALGDQESGNRYDITNRFGYTGRYQFGKSRLTELGYRGTMAEFKNSPALQEQYFLLHVADHARTLSPLLDQGKARYGSWLTLSGLISYAHLLGAGQARNWVKNGIDKKDGNGVYGKTYATRFSGYQIPGYSESGEVVSEEEALAHQGTSVSNVFTGGMGSIQTLLLIGLGVTAAVAIYKKYS